MGLLDKVMYGCTYPVQVLFKTTCPLIDIDDQNKSWNRPLSTLQVFLIPLIVYLLTYQYKNPWIGSCPSVVVYLSISILLAGVVFFTSKTSYAPVYYPIFQFCGFAMCIVWIYAICNEGRNIF